MSYPAEQFDYLFRVIVIGDSGVGKTNLLLRFIKNEFNYDTHPTIGIDFSTKTLQIDSKLIKAQIWDTAGQDRFKSISTAFYRGSVAALLVYDITNPATFKNLDKWLEDVKKYADPNVVLMLIGNKSDLEVSRKVRKSDAKEYAEKHHMSYMETSALDSTNVETAFHNLIKEVYYVYCKFKRNLELETKNANLSIENVKINSIDIEDENKSTCC